MKFEFLTAVIFTSVLSSPLNAAQLRVDEFGNSTYGVYLDGEELNGQFDMVIVDIRPDASFEFANVEADFIAGNAIVLPGAPHTGMKSYLAGIGWGPTGSAWWVNLSQVKVLSSPPGHLATGSTRGERTCI